MEEHTFICVIEDWLKGLAKKIGGESRDDATSSNTMDAMLQIEDLQRFKSCLALALRFTDVRSDGVSLFPEDVIFYSAVEKTHSKLLKGLSMFTNKELVDLFGRERANRIRGMANEAIYAPSPVGSILMQPSPETV